MEHTERPEQEHTLHRQNTTAIGCCVQHVPSHQAIDKQFALHPVGRIAQDACTCTSQDKRLVIAGFRMINHGHVNGSKIQLHVSTINYYSTSMFLTEFSNLRSVTFTSSMQRHIKDWKTDLKGLNRWRPAPLILIGPSGYSSHVFILLKQSAR